MGCVSSNLLNQEEEFSQLGSSALGVGHHIVSLTSTTYGLLSLDPPSTPPPPRFTLGSLWSEPRPLRSSEAPPEVINSWELMAGLDADSFRFSPLLPLPPKPQPLHSDSDKENSNPNRFRKPTTTSPTKPPSLDRFERICPPNGENRVVIYTTTLRGVRGTFEACNAVRAAFEAFGVMICERDVSMDSGFKEELRGLLLKGKEQMVVVPPRVFVKGMYIGGAEDLVKVVEEGLLGELLEGLPRKRVGAVCEGCGDMRFLPCFRCNGSCKTVVLVKEEEPPAGHHKQGRTVVMKCADCNENGLVVCPICS